MIFLALTLAATTAPKPSHQPLAASVTAARALDDATIVAVYDAANTYDIETGMLVQKKGSTADVRNYGAMLVKAHEGARQQGRDLAKKLGVTPTPPAVNPFAADHKAAMAKLKTLSGKAFDRAFLENEIAYHKAVIAAVKSTLLPAIQNAELKQLVVSVAPVFQQHQLAGEALLAKMGN
jgi:putative membrane protein